MREFEKSSLDHNLGSSHEGQEYAVPCNLDRYRSLTMGSISWWDDVSKVLSEVSDQKLITLPRRAYSDPYLSDRYLMSPKKRTHELSATFDIWDTHLKRPLVGKTVRDDKYSNPTVDDWDILFREGLLVYYASRQTYGVERIYDIVVVQQGPMLLLEKIEGDEMAKVAKARRFTAEMGINILNYLALTYTKLERKGVYQGDTAPHNIILDKNSELLPRLIDFNTSPSVRPHYEGYDVYNRKGYINSTMRRLVDLVTQGIGGGRDSLAIREELVDFEDSFWKEPYEKFEEVGADISQFMKHYGISPKWQGYI